MAKFVKYIGGDDYAFNALDVGKIYTLYTDYDGDDYVMYDISDNVRGSWYISEYNEDCFEEVSMLDIKNNAEVDDYVLFNSKLFAHDEELSKLRAENKAIIETLNRLVTAVDEMKDANTCVTLDGRAISRIIYEYNTEVECNA